MDAAVQALVTHLDEQGEALLKEVVGVEESLFQWTPGPGFNSIAILLRHLAGSERYWIGEGVGGIPSGRQRDQEFLHDRPSREDVLRAVEGARRRSREVLESLTAADLTSETPPTVTAGRPPHRPTKTWVLLHYIDHLGYHRGQALLLLKLARTASREASPR